MGLRSVINKRPRTTSAVVAVLVLAIAFVTYREVFASTRPAGSDLRFFSDDDGATYFSPTAATPPGFLHNGRPAYAATVYQCGGKPFVGLLQRFTPDIEAKLAAIDFRPGSEARAIERSASATQVEVKRPGDANWVSASDPAYATTVRITAPQGSTDSLEPVNP